jgi:EAL domain-containing protein (putative c-di-GMP-specific phosphodiesterase class I)
MLTETLPAFSLIGAPFLEYLPVIDLSSGRLLGVEALVRWEHPTKGCISPEVLIPEAERSGDIAPLTKWILGEACRQARRWSPSVQLAVNCTVQQLRRGEVSKAVVGALEESGLHSGQLTLEITEDAVTDDGAVSDMKMLSEMGVQLSIDDVGTNWSSFEPFQRHAIGTVKIDGSFVSGLESAQGINRLVVETVIHMAHSLGMSAVVECVESSEQVEIVRKFEADAAQGFFFSRPLRPEHVEALAGGPDIPRFSLTDMRTLLLPDGEILELDEFTLDAEPEPEVLAADEVEPAPAAEEAPAEAEEPKTPARDSAARTPTKAPAAKAPAKASAAKTPAKASAAKKTTTVRRGSAAGARKPRRTTRRS